MTDRELDQAEWEAAKVRNWEHTMRYQAARKAHGYMLTDFIPDYEKERFEEMVASERRRSSGMVCPR